MDGLCATRALCNELMVRIRHATHLAVPAKAGTRQSAIRAAELWIPASAGMTSGCGCETLDFVHSASNQRVPMPQHLFGEGLFGSGSACRARPGRRHKGERAAFCEDDGAAREQIPRH